MTTTKTLLRQYERWGRTIEEIARCDPNWSDFDAKMFTVAINTRNAVAETLASRGIEIPKQTERC